MQENLFNLEKFRSLKKLTYLDIRECKEKAEEEPFLEPIWRDADGVFHRAQFDLIYRDFGNTRLHEHVFLYVGQHKARLNPCAKFVAGYFEDRLKESLTEGWPIPQEGGSMKLLGKTEERPLYEIKIYCDDLYICPKCAFFHPRSWDTGNFCPWLVDDELIDHSILQQVIESRRNTPEFRFAECKRKRCREERDRVIEYMKRQDDAVARTAAFNAELSKRAVKTGQEFPPPRLQKKAFVYAIRGESSVKIGLASNVRNRVAALQTSCPMQLSILNAWEHHEAPKMEKLLQRRFQSRRISGEWFRLSDDEIALLQRTRRIEDLL